jgi:hypothetical protein
LAFAIKHKTAKTHQTAGDARCPNQIGGFAEFGGRTLSGHYFRSAATAKALVDSRMDRANGGSGDFDSLHGSFVIVWHC